MARRDFTCSRKCIFYLLVSLQSIRILSETKIRPNSVYRLSNQLEKITICTLLQTFTILSEAAVGLVFFSEARIRDSHGLLCLLNVRKTKSSEQYSCKP